MIAGLRSAAHLLRWLGPWTPESRVPPRIRRETYTFEHDGETVRSWVYHPRGRTRGTLVFAMGLHYLGPAHPNADRLARILARAGFVIHVPFIEDYLALTPTPRAVETFLTACDAALDHPASTPRAALFSISFGSLLVLRAATTPRLSDRICGVLCLGGYADPVAALEFVVTGEIAGEQVVDDRQRTLPVVYLILLDLLPDLPADRAPVAAAWRTYIRRTWEEPDLLEDQAAQRRLAEVMAGELAEPYRRVFLAGCSATDDGVEIARRCLDRYDGTFMDPRPFLDALRVPVHIVHGVDDTTIPYVQAHALHDAMPPGVWSRVYLTGLFSHSGNATPGVREVVDEVRTLVAMMWALANLGCPPE